MKRFCNTICILLSLLFFNACATYKKQYNSESHLKTFPQDREISHSFYLIGDAGNSNPGYLTAPLQMLKQELPKMGERSAVVFLGDNVYHAGLVKEGDPEVLSSSDVVELVGVETTLQLKLKLVPSGSLLLLPSKMIISLITTV